MDAYTEKALKSIFENLSSECVSGGRNSSLNKNAMEAYQFVTGGYVDKEHVSRKLSEIASNAGLSKKEIETTLNSAYRGAQKSPRVVKNAKPTKATHLSKEVLEATLKSQDKAINDFRKMAEVKKSDYLARKSLDKYRDQFKQGKGFISTELYTLNGNEFKPVGYTCIFDDGKKGNSSGSGDTGTYFALFLGEDTPDADTCYVCEGVTDALSILDVTKVDCYSACGAGNILKVVELLQPHYKNVIACIDNDEAGIKAGAELLERGFDVRIPRQEGEDFNDVFSSGRDLLKELSNRYQLPQVDYLSQLSAFHAMDLIQTAKAPKYLIHGILEKNTHGLLAGTTGAFKSFIALELANSIATGNHFLKNKVCEVGRVFYICGEGKGGIARRLKGMHLRDNNALIQNISVISSISLNDAEQLKMLEGAIMQGKPSLIIYDTLNSLSNGLDNNSSKDVSKFLKYLFDLSNTVNASTLIVHHYGKDTTRGMEGSHAFKSNADYLFTLHRTGDSLNTTLKCEKQKDGELFSPIDIRLRESKLGLFDSEGIESNTLVVAGSSYTKKLFSNEDITLQAIKTLHAKQGSFTPKDVENEMVLSGTVDSYNQNSISRLVNTGRIEKISRGIYALKN